MKRRTIALMMAAAVAAGSMTGCGSSKTEQTNPETEQTTAKAEVKDTETETSGEGETEAKAEDGQWEYKEATLNVNPGAPLLIFNRTTYQRGIPFEYSESINRGDLLELVVDSFASSPNSYY